MDVCLVNRLIITEETKNLQNHAIHLQQKLNWPKCTSQSTAQTMWNYDSLAQHKLKEHSDGSKCTEERTFSEAKISKLCLYLLS